MNYCIFPVFVSGYIDLSMFIMTGLQRILDLRDYSVLTRVPMLMTALLRELLRCVICF